MDDDQIDVKQPAGEEASISEPSTEEPKAEAEDTSVEEPTQDESHIETEEAPKKGATQRIKELSARASSEKDRADSLEAKIAELTGSVDPQVPGAPYSPNIEPGSELTADQYKQEVIKAAESIVSIKMKQGEAVSRINNESQQVIRTYPQLDPDNDKFDKELSDFVTETTLELVKANPYLASPRKIVDRLMKPYLRSVTKEVGKASESIAKQVSQTAVRPTSVSAKAGKNDRDKSIKELESELGVIY